MSTRERSWRLPVALLALGDLAKGAAWIINLAVAE